MNRLQPPLVLHVIHHLRIGGLENGLVNLVNSMPAYRHAIACIEDYSDFRERIRCPDVEVFALKRSAIGVWRLRGELFRLCRALRPDVVHSRNMSGLDSLLPARLAGVRRCVHGEHGWDVDNIDGRQWKPALLRRMHAPLVDRYITVSRDLQRFLVDRIGLHQQRITQIYNGVDTTRFAPAELKPLAALPPPLREPGLLLIGTVGRAQAVKDQVTLLQAFAHALQAQPAWQARVRLLVIGDGPLLESLKQQAETLGIAGLTWFSGAISNVDEVLKTLDVFVLPSLNEGISNTVLEAMATGLPVLATNVGGNPELVEAAVSGELFEPRDVRRLQGLLERYVSDEDLRRAHATAARRIALERFSLQAMVRQYEAVYDGLVD
ncbi:MAG TPA: TIGR03088 family PEP-CTERM/XrtA system glycosyltransferase [Burkholderiaceae bacterium]|nr:TIGR03088 family PEP-CTERM/XrtA system glycosyltransferase [Burkholderiaceae bacterium]